MSVCWRAGEERLTLCDNLLYVLSGFLELSHLHLDRVSPHGLLQKRSVFLVGVHKELGPRDALPRAVGAARDG